MSHNIHSLFTENKNKSAATSCKWGLRNAPVNVCKMSRELTHWGPVTHICVSELTTIASDNGLSPGRNQAII